MECCLYCGEPIALLQRWKLGRAKGMFCSREHEDAHTELQAQAVMRLVMQSELVDTAEDPPAETPQAPARDDSGKRVVKLLGSCDLAPPAMTARPQNSWRASVVSPSAVTPQPAPPPLEPVGPRFSFANYVAVQIAPTETARPVGLRTEAFESEPLNPVLPDGPSAQFAANLGLSPGIPPKGPDSAVPVMRTGVQGFLPELSTGLSGLLPLGLKIPDVSLSLKMAPKVGCGEWIRSTGRRSIASMPTERNLTDISVHLPVHHVEATQWILPVAGTMELRNAPLAGRGNLDSCRPLESLEETAMLRFPHTPEPSARMPRGSSRGMDLEAARAREVLASSCELETEVAPVYPQFRSDVEMPQELPEFLDLAIGAPLGECSEDCMIHLPAVLLIVKRESAHERGRAGDQLPSFKSIPMQILPASDEPVFSAPPPPRRLAAAAGRGSAW